MAPRHDDGSVPDEVHGGDGVGVRVDGADAAAGLDVPDAHGAVEGGRRQEAAAGGEAHARDGAGVRGRGARLPVGAVRRRLRWRRPGRHGRTIGKEVGKWPQDPSGVASK